MFLLTTLCFLGGKGRDLDIVEMTNSKSLKLPIWVNVPIRHHWLTSGFTYHLLFIYEIKKNTKKCLYYLFLGYDNKKANIPRSRKKICQPKCGCRNHDLFCINESSYLLQAQSISRHALYKSLLSLDVLLPEKLICNEWMTV